MEAATRIQTEWCNANRRDRRRGLTRALIGSDAEQVVRNAPVPVLLVRAAP